MIGDLLKLKRDRELAQRQRLQRILENAVESHLTLLDCDGNRLQMHGWLLDFCHMKFIKGNYEIDASPYLGEGACITRELLEELAIKIHAIDHVSRLVKSTQAIINLTSRPVACVYQSDALPSWYAEERGTQRFLHGGFDSKKEAEQWCVDNGYRV